MFVVKDVCWVVVLVKCFCIVEVLYFCEVVIFVEYLGFVYGVLGWWRVCVLNEEMKEGIVLFIVYVYMFVFESFGFVDELCRKMLGFVSF